VNPQQPLFSVVIPTFNRAPLVGEAVRSVLAQTCQAFEVIVVDDGSTDDTLQALSTFGDRIRLLRQDNRGVSAARNAGARVATGCWIAVLDSDDLWLPQRLERIAQFAQRHADVGAIVTGRRIVRADGSPTPKTKLHPRHAVPRFDGAGILRGVDCGSGAVRRDLFELVDGYDEQIRAGEDVDLWIRLSFHTRLGAVREPLLLNRVHGRTLSRTHDVTGHGRLRIVAKLERDHPGFVAQNRRAVDRFLASAHSRCGRALLTQPQETATSRREAREHFFAALRLDPWNPRSWRYALLAGMTPGLYRRSRLRRPG
jgi:glycosyltransferase involved in cell wall biosynthesis